MPNAGVVAALRELDGLRPAGIDACVVEQDAHLDGHVVEVQRRPELTPKNGTGLRCVEIADGGAGDGQGMDAEILQPCAVGGVTRKIGQERQRHTPMRETAPIGGVVRQAAFPLLGKLLRCIKLVHASLHSLLQEA